eukprot:gene4723-9377_t
MVVVRPFCGEYWLAWIFKSPRKWWKVNILVAEIHGMIILGLLVFQILAYVVSSQKVVDIVSILDHSSALSCLIKVHSIILSTSRPSLLKFRFLLMDTNQFDVSKWVELIKSCYPGTKIEIKNWEVPPSFPKLRLHRFETPVIYARFYIPHIFPDIEKYIYLDNDLVVNGDIIELYSSSMSIDRDLFRPIPQYTIQSRNNRMDMKTSRNSINSKNEHKKQSIIAFTFERHPQYSLYISGHFNMKHPLVDRSMKFRGQEVFFNGGVAVVDAIQWRAQNITARAEQLIAMNTQGSLHDESVGDQGTFFLLFHGEMASLHARWNMRRLPKKSVEMLVRGTTGIIHFAGVTHGDAQRLCYEPLRYPIFLKAVLPLYLSVIASFQSICPAAKALFTHCNLTDAVKVVVDELKANGSWASFHPGIGKFNWPPKLPS